MNYSIYIFGNFGTGYTQYPDDFAKTSFIRGHNEANANSKIAIHREGNLVYYSYYRKLLGEDSQPDAFLGFSVCLNGVYFLDIEQMFSFFEQSVTELAVSGEIVEFSNNGDISACTRALHLKRNEIETVKSSLRSRIDSLPNSAFSPLPPYNYGADDNVVERIAISDLGSALPLLLKSYNRITIIKNSDFNSKQFTGFARRITELYQQNEELNKLNTQLQENNRNLTKQKKQYKWVTLLAALVALSLICIIIFGHNVLSLKDKVNGQNTFIANMSVTIDSLKQAITAKDETITHLQNDVFKRDEMIAARDSFLVNLATFAACPIAVSDIQIKNGDGEYEEDIYSSNSTYIYPRMTAYSLMSGSIDLYVKFYSPNGLTTGSDVVPSGYSYKSTVSLQVFQNQTISLAGWGSSTKGTWPAGSYRIEIWYDNICLGSKSFYIKY